MKEKKSKDQIHQFHEAEKQQDHHDDAGAQNNHHRNNPFHLPRQRHDNQKSGETKKSSIAETSSEPQPNDFERIRLHELRLQIMKTNQELQNIQHQQAALKLFLMDREEENEKREAEERRKKGEVKKDLNKN
jgi:hypothetical protein